MMTGYLDDSYGADTMVCGGWIASDTAWDLILPKWDERIALENRVSARKGLSPIKRYKASDCALCRKDFEGWSAARQKLFTKRLIDIMTSLPRHELPMIFSWGLSLSEMKSLFPKATPKYLLQRSYEFCVYRCLVEIATVMKEYYTQERITLMHDAGDMYPWARNAFKMAQSNVKTVVDQFITIAPMDWWNCHLLQPADMVAYDSFKVLNKRFLGDHPKPANEGHLKTGQRAS